MTVCCQQAVIPLIGQYCQSSRMVGASLILIPENTITRPYRDNTDTPLLYSQTIISNRNHNHRIRVLAFQSEPLQHGATGIRYNSLTRELTDDNREHCWHLSKRSAALLSLFLNAENHMLSRDEIRFQIWGHDVVSDDVINHAICRLRKQLGQVDAPHALSIETIPGVGYRLVGTEVSPQITTSARRWVVLASLFSLF